MSHYLLGMRVDSTSYSDAVRSIIDWVKEGGVRSVFAANTHMVMESYDSDSFRQVVNSADLVTPDGMPLVWWLRYRGEKAQQRVYGPELMLQVCQAASLEGIAIGLFGSTPEVIDSLKKKLIDRIPGLKINFMQSPPFKKLSAQDEAKLQEKILASNMGILFIALGCPKQEQWIYDHKSNFPIVMVAVGAAFNFHAGAVRQAPRWMQRSGLEWFYRLIQEPGRLWKRYLITIPRFVFLVLLEAMGIIHAH